MKKILIVLLASLAAQAEASVSYDNSAIFNAVQVSTGAATAPVNASPYNVTLDLQAADSASWQMSMTCAKGQLKIQQSNNGTSFVDLNVAGSSITFGGGGLTTVSDQLFAVANPAYRYYNFNVVNSSAPVAGTAANCTVTVKQLLKSNTIKSN